MCRALVLALAASIVLPAAAADKEPARAKPLGAWERGAGDAKVTFTFTADTLKAVVATGGATVTVDADYGVTKDGTLFGLVTKVVREGTNDGPSENDLFRFRFTVDKDKLTLKDLHPANDDVKAILEGDYKKK
jgi:hypothetical protein